MYKRNPKYILPALAEVIKKGRLARLKWFDQLMVGHRNLAESLQLLVEYFDRGPDTNMIFLIGMTGIGKTSLATNALSEALEDLWAEEAGPDTRPVLFVAVRSNGQNSFSWGDLYRDVLKMGSGMPAENLRETVVENGIVRFKSGQRLSVGALRDGVDEMVKRRGVRALLLDEAYRFLRFEKVPVMDTTKSIADFDELKLLFIGSYDLLPMTTLYGQATRRAEVVPFFCYRANNKSDIKEFRIVLEKLTSNWPCKHIPNFIAAIMELMDASMGCIGQLKAILSHFLRLQLRSPAEMWTPDMFGRSIKAERMAEYLRSEKLTGEAELRAHFGVPNRYAMKQGLEEIAMKLAS